MDLESVGVEEGLSLQPLLEKDVVLCAAAKEERHASVVL